MTTGVVSVIRVMVRVCDAGTVRPVGPGVTAADTVNSLAGASTVVLSSAVIVTVPVLDVLTTP